MDPSVTVHNPTNKNPVKQLYAFVSRDSDGNEGILAFGDESPGIPLVTSDMDSVHVMKKAAKFAKQFAGNKTIHLLAFTARIELEEI